MRFENVGDEENNILALSAVIKFSAGKKKQHQYKIKA